jgi:hypothetical protein
MEYIYIIVIVLILYILFLSNKKEHGPNPSESDMSALYLSILDNIKNNKNFDYKNYVNHLINNQNRSEKLAEFMTYNYLVQNKDKLTLEIITDIAKNGIPK